MLAVYILLGILALLILLILLALFVPLAIRLGYQGGFYFSVRFLGVPLSWQSIRDSKKEKEKQSSAADQTKKKKPSKIEELKAELTRAFEEDGLEATVRYLKEAASLIENTVKGFSRALVVDHFRLDMLVATGDPADTAVRYGEICAGVFPALTVLERCVRIRQRQVRIEPNFLLDKGGIEWDVQLHLRIFRLSRGLLAVLFRVLLLKKDVDTIDEYKEVLEHGK